MKLIKLIPLLVSLISITVSANTHPPCDIADISFIGTELVVRLTDERFFSIKLTKEEFKSLIGNDENQNKLVDELVRKMCEN